MTVDGKNEFMKKIYLPPKRGILSLVFVLYALLTLGNTFKYFEKVAAFYTIVFYGVILSLALDKVFL